MAAVPERVRQTVALLAVGPADRLLEIGCGGGAAVAQVCPLLDTGTITALDRSPTAVARALRRNAEPLRQGRASVVQAAFTAADLAAAGLSGERFDKIFSVDVNLFWTGPADAELALARSLLAPGGALYTCYEPPGQRLEEIATRVTAAFERAGFTPELVRAAPFVGIVGHP
ncbi:class I SAM-dependent methyltransferase [Streptomyces sp. NPDC048002]|uniref:class I SAM-dependent methyltransferase n=1 Tax=unclassified Streptomyces TaxID=2593676 RepID=UPI0033DEA564